MLLRHRIVIAGSLLSGLIALSGLGLWAADPPAKDKADPKKAAKVLNSEAEVREALKVPIGELPGAITVREICDYLYDKHGLIVRIDMVNYRRLGDGEGAAASTKVEVCGGDPQHAVGHYDRQIMLPIIRGMNVNDLLQETVAQLPGKMAFRIRDNIVLLTPAYLPMSIPQIGTPGPILGWGSGMGGGPNIPEEMIREQIAGQSVSFDVKDLKLELAVEKLRKQTGINVAFDAKCKKEAETKVTVTLDDARVLTVLNQMAEQCELQCVFRENVYFFTTPTKAKQIIAQQKKDIYGDVPLMLVPPGQVTDGFNFYEKPKDLKRIEAPAPEPEKPAEEKK